MLASTSRESTAQVPARIEEKDLVLLGLIGIADPPRTEAIEAVAAAPAPASRP